MHTAQDRPNDMNTGAKNGKKQKKIPSILLVNELCWMDGIYPSETFKSATLMMDLNRYRSMPLIGDRSIDLN